MTPQRKSSWATPARSRNLSMARVARTLSQRTRTPGATSAQGLAHSRQWLSAVSEAYALLTLEAGGCSSKDHVDPCERNCRDISDVMDVEPEVAELLAAFAIEYPEEASMVEDSVRFREMVALAIEEIHAQEVARSAA